MPAPGVIERIAAKSMLGVESEDLTNAVKDIVKQTDEEVEAFRDMVERSRLEQKAESENRAKVYILKEQYRQLDPVKIQEHEEQAHCVIIPAEEYEIQHMKEEAVPYTMPPKLPDIKMLQSAVYDLPHVKGGRHKEPPHDLTKKKKAKRRSQKQGRRKGRR